MYYQLTNSNNGFPYFDFSSLYVIQHFLKRLRTVELEGSWCCGQVTGSETNTSSSLVERFFFYRNIFYSFIVLLYFNLWLTTTFWYSIHNLTKLVPRKSKAVLVMIFLDKSLSIVPKAAAHKIILLCLKDNVWMISRYIYFRFLSPVTKAGITKGTTRQFMQLM